MRIPVKSQINVNRWRHHLTVYFEQQLPDLLEFGFPLHFDRACELGVTDQNHLSALNFPDHVDKYIQEELKFGAMIGPFDNLPIKAHISPFMTREKQGSNTRRIIMDLSWPKGSLINSGVQSDTYLSTTFQLHYPSVDDLVNTLNTLGP